MKGLTATQKKVLEFLKEYSGSHGYPPTVREIGAHFGFLWPAARRHLQSLAKKGVLRITPSKSRGVEVIGVAPAGVCTVPVLGKIRAGEPTLAVEEIDGHISLDRALFPVEDIFSLKVVGDSMKEAGIFHGDFVIVKPQHIIEHGEIGVAIIGDEATVKRILFEDCRVILKPENSNMESVTYSPEEVTIAGKVIGLVRNRI
ncbi:MAG: transcriptional repressor LexA [Proteobacteria bacterium]|nr:transcriptional repressor LexA [Pseudomonadota bacterium]